jgi:uracil-DNA glycosylase
MAETVRAWREYLPEYFPLPHPSPRNRLWMKNNPWFVRSVVPALRREVKRAMRVA